MPAHTCRALIGRARKCGYCFAEKHDCVMNLAPRPLQLAVRRAARAMAQNLIAHALERLARRLRQWKSE